MQNRVVIVTGASSGIGAQTAIDLADSSRLVLVARREDRLRSVAARIAELGGEALVMPADLTDPAACATIVPRVVEHFGTVQALINNAGVFETGNGDGLRLDHIDRCLALNVRAPMLITRDAIAPIAASGGGWIITVSSVAARNAFPGCGVYGATKAAIEQWSGSLREELRDRHIRVGIVAPGPTNTEAWPDDLRQTKGDRMSSARDVSRAIRFLLDTEPTASIDYLSLMPPGGPL